MRRMANAAGVRALAGHPLLCLAAIVLLLLLWAPGAVRAQGEAVPVAFVRGLDTSDIDVLNPAGLAAWPEAGLLYVLQARAMPEATVVAMTPNEERVASLGLDAGRLDPVNIAFDARFRRLLLLGEAGSLTAIGLAADGAPSPSPAAMARFDLAPLGVAGARGLAVGPQAELYLLDGAARQLVRVTPTETGDLDGAAALAGGRVTRMALPPGLSAPGAITCHPRNGLLYVAHPADRRVSVLNGSARQVAVLQLPPGEFVDPRGLAFTFSSDLTDASSIISLYVADTGLPPGERTRWEVGRIVELASPIVHVPGDAATIQAGVDLAAGGDLVLIAPGRYEENVRLEGKAVSLASHYLTTGDPVFIEGTVIDGGGDAVITVASSAGEGTRVVGLTIQNGKDGISASSPLLIYHNRFIGNKDGIDYEAGGGSCRWNVFDGQKDDAIDLDGPTAAVIEDNLIRNSRDDGIEVRLHRYAGPVLDIVIRRNTITDSGEDGIQLIDYPDVSDRVFHIERNLIVNSAQVGLGLMDDGVTTEDLRAASIPERIYLFHNTFLGNDYAVTGGDNVIALNNILANTTRTALLRVDGDSIAAHNLFWGNGTDYENAAVDGASTMVADPLLDARGRPLPGSPAVDAGAASFTWLGEPVFRLPPAAYCGPAPDIGAYEAYRLYLPMPSSQTGGTGGY